MLSFSPHIAASLVNLHCLPQHPSEPQTRTPRTVHLLISLTSMDTEEDVLDGLYQLLGKKNQM